MYEVADFEGLAAVRNLPSEWHHGTMLHADVAAAPRNLRVSARCAAPLLCSTGYDMSDFFARSLKLRPLIEASADGCQGGLYANCSVHCRVATSKKPECTVHMYKLYQCRSERSKHPLQLASHAVYPECVRRMCRTAALLGGCCALHFQQVMICLSFLLAH